jgi:signal transduction histidine kinase
VDFDTLSETWIDPADREQLAAVAAQRGRPVAELVRAAIHLYMRQQCPCPAEVEDRFQQALLSLVKHRAFSAGDLHSALEVITEVAAHTLEVARVGIWLYRDNYTRIDCMNLFRRDTDQHDTGLSLAASDAPAYFQALEQDRVIAADDALNDPHTRELSAYLRQWNIRAMLDAPVHIDGKTAGVICHEHEGAPRTWTVDERNFAASISDLISMVIEQAERKRIELEMLRQSLELEKAKELSHMKSEFINTVAHELRTPITSVIGLAEFLEDGIAPGGIATGEKLPPAQLAHVAQILANLTRVARLVDDLLDVARMQVGSFQLSLQDTNLALLISDNLASVQPLALTAGVALEPVLPAEPVILLADPVRLSQVLSNLLTNAIKFTPRGGHITVRLINQSDHARIEVNDTGIAIAPEDIPKLFHRFSQLEGSQSKGGLGLGLAICKGLVEAHGGHIGVKSILGQGSSFWFTVPHTPPERVTVAPVTGP